VNKRKKLSKNIQTLSPALMEAGKIKIGRKGQTRKSSGGKEFQLPEKQDHFTITTLEKDDTQNFKKDTAIHKELGGDKLKRIPIMLLFDDIEGNFQSRFARYEGKTCVCSGDGEIAYEGDKEIECPCEKSAPDYKAKDKCKMNGTLSVMIRNVNKFGSCWKFRTTGFNSIQGLFSSLALIKNMTGGVLKGIDLDLVISPKTAVNPTTGKPVTIYVVGVEYAGTMQELKLAGIETLKLDSDQRKQLQLLESNPPNLLEDDDPPEDIVDEFYPENADGFEEAEDGAIVDTDSGEVMEETPNETTVIEDTFDNGSVDEAVDDKVKTSYKRIADPGYNDFDPVIPYPVETPPETPENNPPKLELF